MRKKVRIAVCASFLIFLLAGVSYGIPTDLSGLNSADGIDYTIYAPFNANQVWLNMNVRLAQSTDGSLYMADYLTLLYQVTHLGDGPTGPNYDSALRLIEIPVAGGKGIDWGVEGTNPNSPTPNPGADANGLLSFSWGDPNLPPPMQDLLTSGEKSGIMWVRGLKDNFGITISGDEEGEEMFLAQDTGGTFFSASAMIVFTDTGTGTDPVPEPGTLLLLGAGLFGMGAFRYLRRRRAQ